MSEITPSESESIIDAAASGRTVPGHETVGEVLTQLHTTDVPGMTGTAPTLPTSTPGTGRFIRRTAVAAGAAVLSLGGVAAASTAGVDLLDPILGGDDPVVEQTDDVVAPLDEQMVIEVEATGESADPPSDEGVVEGDDEADDDKGPHHLEDTTEGVDPSDGLDDDELDLLCDAADNHGAYVSAVARDRTTEVEGPRGQRVSEAAQSDCGKPDTDDDEVTEADDTDADDTDADGTETDDSETDDTGSDDADQMPGNGNGNANGRGNGNGNGQGNGNNGQGNGNGNNGQGNGNGHRD